MTTDAALPRRPALARFGGAAARGVGHSVLPVLAVVAVIVVLWYGFAVWLNIPWAERLAELTGRTLTTRELLVDTMWQDKPVLPAPHQVAIELWATVAEQEVTSVRSLVHHGGITLSATLLGFAIGTALGVVLAVVIVHSRAMDLSLMPWIVASQTIPILAIAPMIIVVLNSVGVSGLLPKALISAYLCFFPVAVGMVKGLRSPDRLALDLMKTYSASAAQVFWKLRLPASVPFLFASMKVGVALSLVGTIVGEMPTGAVAGLGARLLHGSYNSQTIQIWSALFAAAVLAAGLVWAVALADRLVRRLTGRQT